LDNRIDQGNEINNQIRAISAGLDALRERLDAEFRLIHRAINATEERLASVEERVYQLECRLIVPPEAMWAIERGSRG
jgi:hypothetical protein